jgi:hypothetical protein
MSNILIHIIDNSDDQVMIKKMVSAVPREGDDVRLVLKGNVHYFKVIMVVWVYDEPICPFERVNIGVEEL